MAKDKIVGLVLLSFVSLVSVAEVAPALQITLEDTQKSDLKLTTTHFYGLQNRYNFNLFATGKGVVWDFSKLDLHTPKVIKISTEAVDCKDTPYQDSFPQAKDCLVSSNDSGGDKAKIYYYKTPGVLLGQVTVAGKKNESISDCDVVEDTQYPIFYGKKYNIVLNCNNGSGDKAKTQVVGEVVGEGTLILPNGKKVEDVLRVKSQLSFGNRRGEIKYSYYTKDAGIVLQSIGDSYIVINNYSE
ncbi:hypothetical protein [Entomomonas asaccharolytica]|uniref:Uncharacterized protein n=1 Tax=Entomomonas asaccharolytica TaxID=2785331 RepID=A0A974NE65_9GAMM|nr:hypothetical protein [Entomomonas asaccharolytica]QQP84752.1 hypothetical protein JHT90_10075 [Entomomonas asaccharolytica]